MNKISSTTSTPKRNRLWNFVNVFQNLKIGQKIIVGSIVALALLVIITTLVLINLNTLTADFNFLVEHDQPVLFNAAELEKLTVDMETGQRGFIITGKDEFLEPYKNGQAEFKKLLEAEKVLVSDNPPQVARLEEIGRLHEEWVTVAAEPEIAKRREVNQATVTSDTLQEILRGGVGKGILDELRGVLDKMESSFRAADNLPAAILTVQIAKDMVDQETGERGFIITGEESFLDPYNAGQQALAGHIAELRKLVADDPSNSARLNQVESLASDWVEQAAVPEIQARRDVDAAPATIADVSAMLQAGTGKNILDETRAKFAEFIAIELELTQQRSEEAKQVNRNLIILAIGLTVLGAVIVLGSGGFIAGRITTSLNSLTKASQTIIDGDLSTEVAVTSKDETGVLAGTFNAMTAKLRQAFADVDRRASELATVAEVGTATATIQETDKLLQEVVNLSKERFNLYHSHIFLLDESGENLVLASGAGDPGRQMKAKGLSIPLDREQSLVAHAARERKGVIVNDVTQSPDFLANPLLPNTRSELAVPMIVGGKVIGVFDVQSDQVGRFTDSDINIQTTLAAQVATSIQNVRSFESTQKIAADMGVVAEVGIATSNITDIERLLQEVVDLSKKSFNLYHAHIYLLNEAGDFLELASGAGEVGRQMVSEKRRIPFDSEQSLVARAARTREGVVVNDVTAAADFLPNPLLPDTRSEMAVPMIVAGKVIGVLDVQSEIANRFTDIDVSIKTTLASQIAVALQNARSFSQTQRQAERETTANLIVQKIQSATSIESALQIAARELGHALGMKSTLVELNSEALAGESSVGRVANPTYPAGVQKDARDA